jgi:hypothetical protein
MYVQEVGLWRGGMGWIDLAQNRDLWCTLVNLVINLVFHEIQGIDQLVQNQLGHEERLLHGVNCYLFILTSQRDVTLKRTLYLFVGELYLGLKHKEHQS